MPANFDPIYGILSVSVFLCIVGAIVVKKLSEKIKAKLSQFDEAKILKVKALYYQLLSQLCLGYILYILYGLYKFSLGRGHVNVIVIALAIACIYKMYRLVPRGLRVQRGLRVPRGLRARLLRNFLQNFHKTKEMD